MSWLAWLFLFAGLYVLVVVIRGLVQLVSWLVEEYVIEPRALRNRRESPAAAPSPRDASSHPNNVSLQKEGDTAHGQLSQLSLRGPRKCAYLLDPQKDRHGFRPETARKMSQVRAAERAQESETKHLENHERSEQLPPAAHFHSTAETDAPSQLRRQGPLSPWRRWWNSLRVLSLRRGYDYWVACALVEEDRQMRVRFLSKALQQNPSYHPAWGMKGHALFELGRYDDAIACFDKSLELHPSALVWYRKGLCYDHKGQSSESLRCYAKAIAECRSGDEALIEEITRAKRRVEEQLHCVQAR